MPGRHHVQLATSLESLIETRGFSRNRKRICAEVGISPSALTLYLQEKIRPSFDTLIAFADFFDVSLDYLVFGAPQAAPTPVDYGPVARYIDLALAESQRKTDQHAALFGRIARVLSDQIADAARDVAAASVSASGMLGDVETMLLESYSLETWIATTHLRDEVQGPVDKPAAMGRFLPTVARNLGLGRKYRYLLAPEVGNWRPMVASYLRLLQERGAPADISRFRTARAPLIAGCAFYHLHLSQLSTEQAVLYERIRDHVSDDGWVGYLAPPSGELHADALMDAEHLSHARPAFERLWRSGEPL